MKNYERKGIVVSAVQYTGENDKEIVKWLSGTAAPAKLLDQPGFGKVLCIVHDGHTERLAHGDWIILGVQNEGWKIDNTSFASEFTEIA